VQQVCDAAGIVWLVDSLIFLILILILFGLCLCFVCDLFVEIG
jgi:hypothetical protein